MQRAKSFGVFDPFELDDPYASPGGEDLARDAFQNALRASRLRQSARRARKRSPRTQPDRTRPLWKRDRNSEPPGSGELGAVSAWILPVLALTLIACLGHWRVLGQWSRLAETQTQLDRCVARSAHALRDLLTRVERTNETIGVTRTAIAAAILDPALAPTLPTLKAALLAQARGQDLELTGWKTRRTAWLIDPSCGPSHPQPLPALELPIQGGLWRPPPDPIGEQALTWSNPLKLQSGWRIERRSLTHPTKIAAAAKVHHDTRKKTWAVRWVGAGPNTD